MSTKNKSPADNRWPLTTMSTKQDQWTPAVGEEVDESKREKEVQGESSEASAGNKPGERTSASIKKKSSEGSAGNKSGRHASIQEVQ